MNELEGKKVVIRKWDFIIENVENLNLLIMTRSLATESDKNIMCYYNFKFPSGHTKKSR